MMQLLTTKQTAELLGVSPGSLAVDRCRARWRIPYLKVGKAVRYDRDAVLRWLRDRNPDAIIEEGGAS